jgi:hypothetical protein
LGYENGPIPTMSMNTLVAPFWDDLFLPTVYYEVRGTAPNRRLIVQWQDADHWEVFWSTVTFQAILYESTGEIKFQYLDTDFGHAFYDYGASATVGIQQNPGHGLEYSYNAPAAPNGAAVLFGPILMPPSVLLDVHPNERAQGPGGSPRLGTAPWQPSGLGPAGYYNWKVYEFDGGDNLWIQVCAQTFSSSQNAVGDDDNLRLVVDGQIPDDVWSIMTGASGSHQWKGNAEVGSRRTLEFQPVGLTAGLHRLELWADETPIIWWVKVCDLDPR